MITIKEAYLNALLADSTYVDLSPDMNEGVLKRALDTRMTPALASYIASNFEVISAVNSSEIPLIGSGFDATVWRGKAGGDYAGQVFVSMRGTEPPPDAGGADLLADADLALATAARSQIVDMINWWLRETASPTEQARQIRWDALRQPNFPSLAIVPGFVDADRVAGTGGLVGITRVQIDGHSLGGHLASAFARIFGGNTGVLGSISVKAISTFNSAGFKGDSADKMFQDLQTLLGTGVDSYVPVKAVQTNYFAANGINVTTNDWWFTQMGARTGLSQEESTGPSNHSMYRLTDLLALGTALEKLDSTFTMDKLNALSQASSNEARASLEALLDNLRRVLAGRGVVRLPVSDAPSGEDRNIFNSTLSDLQKNPVFTGLMGLLHIELVSKGIAAKARSDFGALIALQDLSPLYVSGATAVGRDKLAEIWQIGRAADYAAWTADKFALAPTGFSDRWIADRSALLQVITSRNSRDITGTVVDVAAPTGQATLFRYQDANGQAQSFLFQPNVGRGLKDRVIAFGGSGVDELVGVDNELGDHLYGGAGADTLNGLGGNDYLEGGSDLDVYVFDGKFGSDTVLDIDGKGVLRFDGTDMPLNALKRYGTESTWEDSTGQFRFVRVANSAGGNDLQITKFNVTATSKEIQGTVTVKNFRPEQFGLNLALAAIEPPAAGASDTYIFVCGDSVIDSTKPDFEHQVYQAQGVLTYTSESTADQWVYADESNGGQRITTGAGNDVIAVGRPYKRYGDGLIWGPDPGGDEDYVSSGAGNDVVVTGFGSDVINGGDGDDILYSGEVGSYTEVIPDSLLLIGRAFQSHDPKDAGSSDIVDGGAGNDLIRGGMGADVLFGGDGNDELYGMEGDDLVLGGSGSDLLYGDSLHTTIAEHEREFVTYGYASPGNDTLNGEAGTDRLVGGIGKDQLFGGDDDDSLFGDTDSIDVAEHQNLLWIPAQFHDADYLDGGNGNDYLLGGGGADTLLGGAGNDNLKGDQLDAESAAIDLAFQGDDYLDGGDGNDVLIGDGGNDTLLSGSGNDVLRGGLGNDTLIGEAGGTKALYGEDGDDTLISTGDSDWLEGGAGDDTYLITLQEARLVGSILAQSTPVVKDDQGNNTITIVGGPSADASYNVFSQGGHVYLGVGTQGRVALDDETKAENTSLDIGSSKVSLTSLVARDSADGNIRTAIWSPIEGVVSTATQNYAQKLTGSAQAEQLDGGSADDTLTGGAGADVLIGGQGSDALRGGASDLTDDVQDVFVFRRGDGVDRILAGAVASDPMQRDVIRFGPDIDPSQVTLAWLPRQAGGEATELYLAYGTGDGIVLSTGAELGIRELEFADGTRVGMAQLIAGLQPLAPPLPGVGTSGDDLLKGDAGDNTLKGLDGDDDLDGGTGSDVLIGGDGTNIYRFNSGSGSDLVRPTAGEHGVLMFDGISVAQMKVSISGGDLLLEWGGQNQLRLEAYAKDPLIAANWQIRFNGAADVPLGNFVDTHSSSNSFDLVQRKTMFSEQQFWQLKTLGQRYDYAGSRTMVAPIAVTQDAVQMRPDEALSLTSYLTTSDQVSSRTQTTVEPVYETITLPSTLTFPELDIPSGVAGVFRAIPPGAQLVFMPVDLPLEPWVEGADASGHTERIAYLTPGATQTQLVGYKSITTTVTISVASDTAIQHLIAGTSGNDEITSPQFRGVVEAGAGNDDVRLGQENSGSGRDWGGLLPGQEVVFPNVQYVDRGLGAWIDGGTGDDSLFGTDGNDVIIGGAGSDLMDGQAGADTYLVSASESGVDHIADNAMLDWGAGSYDFIAYGGDVTRPNHDVVEFDDSVALSRLAYRWSSVAPEDTRYKTLELLSDGKLFLQVDYRVELAPADRDVSLPGIEEFRFADGRTLSIGELLATLPEAPPAVEPQTPVWQEQLADLTATEDAPFSWSIPPASFSDPQGRPLVLSATLEDGRALPAWLSFDSASGQFSGTPDNAQVGSLSLRITATNDAHLSASDVLVLTIGNVNDAPTLASALTDQGATEDAAWAFTVPPGTFADVDVNDTLTLTAAMRDGTPLPDWLVFDAATRRFSGTPRNADVGPLNLEITATDAAGATATAAFVLNIANANDAPQPGEALSAQSAIVGATWSYSIPEASFTDVDVGDSLRYSAQLADGSALPAWLSFDADTRSFSATPDVAQVGALKLRVTATDSSGASASSAFTLTVQAQASPGKTFTGTTGNDSLVGGSGPDILNGLAGNDRLDGGAGADTLAGGPGNDSYVVDNAGDIVTEKGNAGTDNVDAYVSFILGANVENLTLTGSAAIDGTGNSLANTLTGNAAANRLNGGSGADTMVGGLGDDTYVVDRMTDVVVELAGGGNDTIESSVTLTLAANVENLTLTGVAHLQGTGNAQANVLRGNGGNNRLDGSVGTDILIGGLGNDTYVLDDAGDQVIELAGEGTDTVSTTVSMALSANVENLTLSGGAAIDGTGNALNNTLTGNAGRNVLNGGEGADRMVGGAGDDSYVVDNSGDLTIEGTNAGIDAVLASLSWTLAGNVENLTLSGTQSINATGNGLANTLMGNAGDNALDGKGGADTMVGGKGNDSYVVDNAGDVVREEVGEGNDTVNASIAYTLGANLENLVLIGAASVAATGNSLNNRLNGNSGNNILDGKEGADSMAGGKGNDSYVVDDAGDTVTELVNEGIDTVTVSMGYRLGANLENLILAGSASVDGTGNGLNNRLTGNAGNNVLDGAEGADIMAGGAGDDSYHVDNAGDATTEAANAGNDTVFASLDWTLATNLEHLILTGTQDLRGTGNASANVLTGNVGSNTLDGKAGADTMIGGKGDDGYVVDNASDIVREEAGEGIDTVTASISTTLSANVENLTLSGTGAINGTGNDLANRLTGNAGRNTLAGGTGNDSYQFGRGGGSDIIVEDDATAGNTDMALFEAGIATSDLWFRRAGDSLEVSVIGTADKLTVKDWYLGASHHVEQFRTNDGHMLLDAQVQNLVQAMAAFAPPAAGVTQLPAAYAQALNPVLAASWQ